MGEHSRASGKGRLVLLSVLGLALVLGLAAGVQAAVRTMSDTGDTGDTGSGADQSTESSTPAPSGPARSGKDPAPDATGAAQGFPGQPKKKSGLNRESGLASGLGKDAGDLAAKAQDLVDSDGQEQRGPRPFSFRLSSYNILGAAHTSARGNKPRYASGERRMDAQLAMLRGQGVEVVGFQEFEPPQFRSFMRRTGGSWGVYPALSKGRGGLRQSIAWRRDTWELADYGTIPIPYFRGSIIPMPVILLTHKETERQVYLINIHNPASNPRRGNNERWRDVATNREVAKVRSLRKAAPGVPVILMGDFNEKAEAFCRVAGRGDIVAANPGGTGGGCRAPELTGIDWIFGTDNLTFSDYQRLDTGGASDHPMLVTTARSE